MPGEQYKSSCVETNVDAVLALDGRLLFDCVFWRCNASFAAILPDMMNAEQECSSGYSIQELEMRRREG
jgi:hypothetical protein